MNIFRKTALGIGASALLLSSTAPAFAAVQRHDSASVLKASGEWNGWGHNRHRRHRDRIDGGDVLLGIGLLVGIAAIADAASKSDRKDRAPQRYPDNYPSNDDGYDRGYDGGYDNAGPADDYRSDSAGRNDVSSAVQTCSSAAEQRANDRVSGIGSVDRDGNGWRVEGDLSGGKRFTCGTSDGRVDYLQVDNSF